MTQISKRQLLKLAGSLGSCLAAPSILRAQTATVAAPAATPVIPFTQGANLKVTELASGLANPWGLAALPDGRFLVTERSGQMLLINGSQKAIVTGVLPVMARNQGGLLDVALSPRFAQDGWVFYSFAKPMDNNESVTAVARAKLVGNTLTDTSTIFQQSTPAPGAHHFGSRLVFDREGHLFVTTGDRYQLKEQAQSVDNHLGKVLRITIDGKPAPGNPLLNRTGARPEIWSFGHRNLQGAALHPVTGELWTNEHGARGGDEINITLPNKNYGWPVITHGIDYSGAKIADSNTKAGLEQPNHVWVPSIAVSGMAFDPRGTQGKQTVLWVGGLRSQVLVQVTFDGNRSVRETRYLESLGQRIRDVRWVKDRLLLLTDHRDGKLLSVEPPAMS